MIGVNPKNTPVKSGPETPCLAMRPREAAKALGISERLLWEQTKKGMIPHIRLGSAVLYSVDALRDWLEQCTQTALIDNEKMSK